MIRIWCMAATFILVSTAVAQETPSVTEQPITETTEATETTEPTPDTPEAAKAETPKPQATASLTDAPAIPLYHSKIVYRQILRDNHLNPTDDEIQSQINAIKENGNDALFKLIKENPTPVEDDNALALQILEIQQKKPKRLGNHQLYINPDLF